MKLFAWNKKMDKALEPFGKLSAKKRIPVIVIYSVQRNAKSRILASGGKIRYEYEFIPAISCELPANALEKIAFLPEVKYICFDHTATLCMRKTSELTGSGTARLLGLTGKGVGIGIIDTGVYPHPELVAERRSIKYFKDLIGLQEKPYDDNGHGTFLCGCIAASGCLSDGLFRGVASDANLYVVKAFHAAGQGRMSDILEGIEVLLHLKDQEGIRLLCLPFEIPGNDNLRVDPLRLAVEKANEAGLVVFTPAGNSGPAAYTIHSPGSLPGVVTVGGVSAYGNDSHKLRAASGGEASISTTISAASFSSRGPTLTGQTKPDVLAPCVSTSSLNADTAYFPGHRRNAVLKNPFTQATGTSIACAIVCGYAALLLEKHPTLTPQDVKALLCLSTMSIGESKYTQGSGMFLFNKAIGNYQTNS